MGTVWAAEHTVTRRSVAMKFLADTVRHKTGLRQRFLREASAASALRHANAVEILDVFDYAPESPVLVMELLTGETLGRKLARDERMGIEETAALLLPVVSAVGTAHALGIVHRDLKPENIFLAVGADAACPKVLDFGIAKLSAELYLDDKSGDVLTDTGAMLGTPCYMAPEQATGDGALDHRADVWSLGVILYECLSGVRPVEGDNLAQVITRLVSAAIIPLERLAPELPHEVSATVMQMLCREASRRPGLDEVALVLSRYTRVKVPPFGLPKLADRQERPSGEPRAKVANTISADPRGATLLSSPPVASSVAGQVSVSAGGPKMPRALSPAVLALAAVMALVAWLFWPRSDPASVAATSAAAASAHPDLTALAAPARPPSALPPVPSGAPTPAAAGAAPAAGSELNTGAPRPRPVSVARRAPAPAARAIPPPRRPASSPAGPASPLDEETLFSGRK